MTTAATSYEAILAANVANMFANSATFQTLVGVANATDALAFIEDTWGGTPGRNNNEQNAATNVAGTVFTTTAPFVVIRPDPMESNLIGLGTWSRSGTIDSMLWQLRKLTGETPYDSMQRWRNVHGGIRADLESLFGTSGCLATGEISGDGPIFTEDAGVDQLAIISHLKIKWWA